MAMAGGGGELFFFLIFLKTLSGSFTVLTTCQTTTLQEETKAQTVMSTL